MRFSERMGLRQARTAIQVDFMDAALRAGLWNVFEPMFVSSLSSSNQQRQRTAERHMRGLWDEFFKLPIDEAPEHATTARDILKPVFLGGEYLTVYDLIEFTVERHGGEFGHQLGPEYNRVLEREMSGYRFVGDSLSPVSNEHELQAIEEGLQLGGAFSAAAAHLDAALRMLSDRQEPDYRNSVKESISAVESAARVVTGREKPTLGKLLPVLEKSGRVHPSQKDAFLKLYGYTSDEGGIRHAMLEESDITFADAKYMLVVCAAFVAYLQAAA